MSGAAPPVARFHEVQAPAGWQTIDFISDLHLQASEPRTVRALQDYLETTTADAVFILGDLFEVWVGDDVAALPGFEQDCAQLLRRAAGRRPLYFMVGNRDFLLDNGFLQASGMQALDDPAVLTFAGERWLLTHGDALCLDDIAYQQFRLLVRNPAEQQAFLARSLPERVALARALRSQSEARKAAGTMEGFGDVDSGAAVAWLQATGARTLIHGHTHRPADHDLPAATTATMTGGPTSTTPLRRIVLSDWDATASPPRAQVLRLTAHGLERINL